MPLFLLNPSHRWYYPLRWLLLIAVGLAVYGQTFGFGFVFDDHIFIVNDDYIRSFDRIHELLFSHARHARGVAMYSFAFNYFLNQLDPRGYHIFNFAVHILTTALVWATARVVLRIAKRDPQDNNYLYQELPFIIALLFLVHPCQTQAVTYITQRFESMATFFYVGAVYCYLRARLSPSGKTKVGFFTVAGLCAALGIMTKEVVATLPVMVLATEMILLKARRSLVMAAALAGVLFTVLVINFAGTNLPKFSMSFPSESHDGDIITTGKYFLTQMRVFLTFARLLVFPVGQNLEYDYPLSTGIFSPPLTFVGMVLMGTMAVLVFWLRRNFPLIAFGMAWMLITFSINMVPRPNVIFEHKMYLISFGFCAAAVGTLYLLIKNQKTLAKLLVLMIVVLSVFSFARNQTWRNELVLWEDIVKKSPEKSRSWANLGRVYGNMGRFDEAIGMLNKAIAMDPTDDVSYMNRGVLYGQKGDYDQALRDLTKAIEMDPTYLSKFVKRAWIYTQQHNDKAAQADLSHAGQGNSK